MVRSVGSRERGKREGEERHGGEGKNLCSCAAGAACAWPNDRARREG